MKPAKAMTIRRSAEQAEALEAVAAVDSLPLFEVIRTAISDHIESRKRDREFRDSLKDRITRTSEYQVISDNGFRGEGEHKA